MSLLPEQSLIFSSMLYLDCTRDSALLGDYYKVNQHQFVSCVVYLTTNNQAMATLADAKTKSTTRVNIN